MWEKALSRGRQQDVVPLPGKQFDAECALQLFDSRAYC